MNKNGSLLTPIRFANEQERKYKRYIENRARPLVAFVYWLGGILPLIFLLSDYFNQPLLFAQVIQVRSLYLCFWALLTFFTISRWRILSLKQSLLIYVSVGLFYITFLNIIILDRHMQVVPSALFFLFGIVICQLGSRSSLLASFSCMLIPLATLHYFDQFGDLERTVMIMLIIWSIATWLASIILEKVNRRLFKYEQDINKANREKQALLEKESESNRFKREFLANMSHEMRTPLTAIMGYAESYFHDNQSRETRDSTVKTIFHNGEHLLTLVNDILDLSKIEAGKFELDAQQVNMFDVLHQVEKMQQVIAGSKGLSFSLNYQYPFPDKLIIDPIRLKQVLINLCKNAIKFTDRGSIDVDISYHLEHQELEFTVRDTGIGMSQDTLNVLFEAYSQAPNQYKQKYAGTGLGLYISKQLVEKMGGHFEVHSKENQGSSFHFQIKAETSPNSEFLMKTPTQAIDNSMPNNITKHLSGSVLLAEDHKDNRQLIQLKLEKLGLSVDAVSNGEAAVEHALMNEYQVILMDIQMPKLNGLEAIKIIRQTDLDIPVIALTANAMPQDIKQYLELGFNAHIGKPIEVSEFAEVLSRYCKTKVSNGATLLPVPLQSNQFSLDDETYQNLIKEYVESLPCEIELIKYAKSAHDWQKLNKICHNLKGSAGNFGFIEITNAAAKLEQIINSKKLGEIDSAFDTLYHALNEALYKNER